MAIVRVEIDMTTHAGRRRWTMAHPLSRFVDEDNRHWIEEGNESIEISRGNEHGQKLMQIMPPGTVIYGPDPIHRVTLQFPDADSAVVFYEWCRQVAINTEKGGHV